VRALTLNELADLIDVNISLLRYAGQAGRWTCQFSGVEVMESGCLTSAFGNGSTPQEAMEDFAKNIKGKRIAIGAFTPRRREFNIPLEVIA
jgi:hypothetical protein